MFNQLYELITHQAEINPGQIALVHRREQQDYQTLAQQLVAAAQAYRQLGLQRFDRVAVYLPKQLETVQALFAATAADGVMVPINPVLKPEQVGYILRDCDVKILVTSTDRANRLHETLTQCPVLAAVVIVDSVPGQPLPSIGSTPVVGWAQMLTGESPPLPRVNIDADMAAILYTSGSTGAPKGVVLSHRNMIAGALSVARYLGNHADERILSVLPLSFDAGFSQLTTAFRAGARAILLDYLLARDVIRTAEREQVTGITGVPPLWVQLAELQWPDALVDSLRYIANTGGHMPMKTLAALRQRLPNTQVFLMYGLTEAFRSTYLPPDQVDQRPDSIGKAIPNAEVMVVREDGSVCADDEPGELVHRGALVALGYWNDNEKTEHRFRPAPGQPAGIVCPEIAVWSGDTVRRDRDGYLYFVGRRDDMIKTSGYRVSPTEVEEVVHAAGGVAELAAIGVHHPQLGQAIVVVVNPDAGFDETQVLKHCQQALPKFMVPERLVTMSTLPKNPNGKIDRKALSAKFVDLFQEDR